jgi:hypothetical protein
MKVRESKAKRKGCANVVVWLGKGSLVALLALGHLGPCPYFLGSLHDLSNKKGFYKT